MSKRKNREHNTTPEWRAWKNEYKGVLNFLSRLRRSNHPGGKKWRDAMMAHYSKRLSELRSHPPSKYKE